MVSSPRKKNAPPADGSGQVVPFGPPGAFTHRHFSGGLNAAATEGPPFVAAETLRHSWNRRKRVDRDAAQLREHRRGVDMSKIGVGEVLVREGIQQSSASSTAVTYPLGLQAQWQTGDTLERIAAIRADLGAGNVEAAIRGAHFVSGDSARLGQRRVASLVRHAVRGARLGLLHGASEMLSQAEREVLATR
jgi:hypothetical protein